MNKMRNVDSFVDRHGKRRFRFRKTGFPTYYFVNKPGELGFQDEYKACLIGQPPQKDVKRKKRIKKKPRSLVSQAKVAMAQLPDAESFVYFVGPRGGPIKIGFAASPARRLKDIQIGNHMRLNLWALMPGSMEDEARIHLELAPFKIEGEWFRRAPDVMDFIEKARKYG